MESDKSEIGGVNESTEVPSKKVNLDNILVEEIGEFGRYQIRTLILTVVVIIFVAWAATEYIFTTARINTSHDRPLLDTAFHGGGRVHQWTLKKGICLGLIPTLNGLTATCRWTNCSDGVIYTDYGIDYTIRGRRGGHIPTPLIMCLIPECEGTKAEDFSPTWILNAVPASGNTFDNCLRFDSANATARSDECPAEWFNPELISGCTEYVYETTHTVVYDYGLACEEWRRAFIGTAQTFGNVFALPITGFTSDRWGRRFALSLNAVNTAWIGVTRFWADTYYGFVISEMIESAVGAGAFSCAHILVMELVGPKYRVAAGAAINTFFSLGQVLMALIAWAVPNWRYLTLSLYIPQFITLSYFWIMPESVRWYMSKGRYEDAQQFLNNVARTNGGKLSEKSLQDLKEHTEAEKIREETKVSEPWLIVLVFRNKTILKRCFMSPIWWFTSGLVYYGMSINAVNMSGNKYVNYMAVASAEIPGYWIAVPLMGKIGRRPVLIGAYWICAACLLGYIFLPKSIYGLSLTIYLIGKLSIAVVMMLLYIYTSEIYPTRHRHSLFAFSSMVGRMGAMVAPLTPAFGAALFDTFPSLLFFGFSLLSGVLVFFAPETLGTKLPDTMEEAANIGIKKTEP